MSVAIANPQAAGLTAPTEGLRCGDHTVQFYDEEAPFIEAWGHLIGNALVAGNAAVLIATKTHRDALARQLSGRGLDVARVIRQGRYVQLDAADTLSKIMVDELPHAGRFADLVGGVLLRAKAAATGERPSVTAFGEMVAVLWEDGKSEAALRLERLWNDLARSYPFSLQCGYPMGSFAREERGELFLKICAEHSRVVPAESYTALPSEDERLRSVAQLQQRAQVLEARLALHESERRFRLFVEAVQDYAVFMLDPEGRVTTWNTGAERIKGYKASEIIGRHFSTFYPEEDLRSGKPQWELEVAARDGRFEDQGWRIRKDGSRFWANVIITALRGDGGKLIGFGKVTRDFTERMQAEEALRKANAELEGQIGERIEAERKLSNSEQSLRQLSFHLLRSQDEERRRIGRDLHDTLGQYLAMLMLKLDSLNSAAEDGDPAQISQEITHCASLCEECIKEVRTLSYLLYPPMLEEMGLKSAVPWYLDGFAKRSGIQVSFDVSLDFPRLAPEVELALFRVIQESLTNVHKHSGSQTADVRLFTKDGAVVLEVRDKGSGVPRVKEAGQDWRGLFGVGLRSMNERMSQIGGRLEFSSSQEGTMVTAAVPVEESKAAASGVSR